MVSSSIEAYQPHINCRKCAVVLISIPDNAYPGNIVDDNVVWVSTISQDVTLMLPL